MEVSEHMEHYLQSLPDPLRQTGFSGVIEDEEEKVQVVDGVSEGTVEDPVGSLKRLPDPYHLVLVVEHSGQDPNRQDQNLHPPFRNSCRYYVDDTDSAEEYDQSYYDDWEFERVLREGDHKPSPLEVLEDEEVEDEQEVGRFVDQGQGSTCLKEFEYLVGGDWEMVVEGEDEWIQPTKAS